MRVKTLPIFLAFFLMGLADAMGPMSDGTKNQYQLSNPVATLLPFIVPVVCFAYLLMLSLQRGRKSTNTPGQRAEATNA